MKRLILLFSILCCISVFSCSAYDRPIPIESLPLQVKTFVTTHFKGRTIVYAEKESYSRTLYEIRLDDGTEISFDKKCEWDKVDMNYNRAVPSELIPAFVKKYVDENFNGNGIVTKIDKERYGYEVEINDNIEIKFNRKGQVVDFDD